MSTHTMKLLKCPSCGGPIDPPADASSTKCPYCGSAIVIPESLRKTDTNQQSSTPGNLFSGMDMVSMLGYGAQWSQVVQLAQQGKKEEAVQKYMSFSSISESDARRTVEGLANTQVYDISSAYNASYIAPVMSTYADTAKTVTKWSLWMSCGITAFVMLTILLVTGVILFAVFQAF
ncbi:MAG: hypothetical protein JNK32_09910 [Anaerolineales bacterium]|nr:hypothetical protein [Anaerolineales bacterium]